MRGLSENSEEMPPELVEALEQEMEEACMTILMDTEFNGVLPQGKWKAKLLDVGIVFGDWTWLSWEIVP